MVALQLGKALLPFLAGPSFPLLHCHLRCASTCLCSHVINQVREVIHLEKENPAKNDQQPA